MSFRGKPPPKGYIPGIGRGAVGFQTRSDVGPGQATVVTTTVVGSRAAEVRAVKMKMKEMKEEGMSLSQQPQYTPEDDEADKVWEAVERRLQRKRKLTSHSTTTTDTIPTDNDNNQNDTTTNNNNPRAKIGAQFHDLKQKLASVSETDWLAIPEVGDHSLKYKQSSSARKQDTIFTPLTDSLLDARHQNNIDATAGNKHIRQTATTNHDDNNDDTEPQSPTLPTLSAGLSQARGTVLGMNLDKMSSDHHHHPNNMDAQGYLQRLTVAPSSNSHFEIGDLQKARLLLKSVRDTNPHHGPGWIAAARVEESAGKLWEARQIMQQACERCPHAPDVWAEAARLHPPDVARRILATAVRHLPSSVTLFLQAAALEPHTSAQKVVLRKGLEQNPTSELLWKAAIELEEAEDAKILLSVAVEKIPHAVDMWLALAKLESYENAQKVLNKARKVLPTDRSVWIAAAKLEESQNHIVNVDPIVSRALKSLQKNDANVQRNDWIEEAKKAERSGAVETCKSIIRHSIGLGIDDQDRFRTWSNDAKSILADGFVETARAVLQHALEILPKKRKLWSQSVELERHHGNRESLDAILTRATKELPEAEIFWLLRAKEIWVSGDVEKARQVLAEAFEANSDSEAVWLAAAKLEWENGEIVRARLLLKRAQDRAPSARVFMKSAVLEREQGNTQEAIDLIETGIEKYPDYAKLYMIGGQIFGDDQPTTKENLDKARMYFQRGIERLPSNSTLWILASRLEERSSEFDPSLKSAGPMKARSLLELARIKNPKNPELWVESIRLERRGGNLSLAKTMMAKALQECPNSGLLLAENITSAPRVEQKSKSADAIKRCPEDPRVIVAVASLFASERKFDKARKWFDRAVQLNPDLGDSWGHYYSFELASGTDEQQKNVRERCVAAEPKHGELWTKHAKAMVNRKLKPTDVLNLVAKEIREQKEN